MALSKPRIMNEAPKAAALNASPQRWWLLALLFTAMLISYVHRGAFSVAAPFMAKDLGLLKVGIGIVLSSFFWVYAAMQVPPGWLVGRVRRAREHSLGFLFGLVAVGRLAVW